MSNNQLKQLISLTEVRVSDLITSLNSVIDLTKIRLYIESNNILITKITQSNLY